MNLSAQEFFFKQYTEEDGLPSGNVFDVAQDSLGRMWIATRNGIVAYDAASWNYFDQTKIFENVVFVKLDVDNNGNVWAANEERINNLYCFKNEEWHKFNIPDTTKINTYILNDFKVDVNNKDTLIAIAGFTNNLAVYYEGKWKEYNFRDSNEVYIYSLQVIDNQLLIFTSKGTFAFDKNNFALIPNYQKNFGFDFIPYKIIKSKNDDNKYYALGSNTLAISDNGNEKLIKHKFSIQIFYGAYRFYLLPDYFGLTFFGNSQLIYMYNEKTDELKLFNNADEKLTKVGPISLYIDFEKNLWIGGLRGLLKLQTPFVLTFNEKEGLLNDEVTSVIERDGKYYFGHSGGITIYDHGKFKQIKYNFKKVTSNDNRTLDFCLDDKNNIWIAVNDIGFAKLTPDDKIEKWYKTFTKNGFKAVALAASKDGKLYAANSSKIYEFDGKEFKLKYDLVKDFNTSIRKIFFNQNNELVVGSMQLGLLRYSAYGEIHIIKSNKSNSTNSIYSFYEDDQNTFVGTSEGLFKVIDDTLIKLNDSPKLNRPIYFITKDANNHYWFGTDNGVLVQLENGFFHLTPRNGLLGYETNRDAGFVDSKNQIWVGTDRGLSVFQENFVMNYERSTPKIISFIKVDDRYLPINKSIVREHDSRNIQLYVTTVSFIDELNNKIKYQLEGINSEFKTVDQKEGPYLTFYNLGSGTYNFNAYAVNPLQTKSEIYNIASINIKQPFYLTWWFFMSVFLVVMIFVYIVVRYFERKRQAQKLEEEVNRRTFQLSNSEKKYKNLLNRIQDVVFVIQDSKVVFVNDAFYQISGYNQEEVIDFPFEKFIAPEDRALVKDRYERRKRDELVPAEYELKLLHKNGFTRIFVNMHVGAFDYEGKLTTIGTLKDITAFKLSQEKIVKSEARLRALTNMLPDMMFELDENGLLLDYHLPDNSPFTVHPLKLVGKNIKEFLPRSLYRLGMGMTKKALESGKMQIGEFFIKQNNVKRFYEARVVVSSGRKVLIIIRDISERKESEKQLIEAKEQAEESDKLKSEFLAQVSHEIRTPINTILNFASLIKEDCYNKIDPDLRDSFSAIENGGRRLIRTIDLILNMSQIQTQAYKPNFKSLNIDDDVLASVYSELKSFAESKNLSLNYEIEEGIKLIKGDSYTLGQIFVNLIDNAIKYTNEGSITLRTSSDEENIFVEVIDTGIGISKEFLPSLFTPFSQEETGYTRKFEGTGLGLALVKSYVDLNKGEITVDSTKGKGTTFKVKFSRVQNSSL